MSLNGVSDLYPNTLSGLSTFNSNSILLNGVDITTIFVPFINSPSDVDLAAKNLTTTGRVQTTILKLPSLTQSTTKFLQLDANKEVISTDLAGTFVVYTGSTNNLDMGVYRVFTTAVPSFNNELVNKLYVDTTFPNFGYLSANYLTQANASIIYAPIASPTFTGTVSGITSSMVGLGNVDNTSDINKPVSTATQTALNLKANIASPTFTGTVSGITSTMVGLGNVDNTSDLNKPVSTAVQTVLTFYAPLASPTFTGTVSGITRTMVGLGNVDNTSDANKPVSTATQTALNLKADLASPTLTGIPSAPTASPATNTTQIATTAFVTNAISGAGVSTFSAGSTGFTPNTATTGAITLAGTLNVANGGTGVTTSTGTTSVVLSASPTLTGVPLAPTASPATNTTQIATTAFVMNAVGGAGVSSFSAGTTGLLPSTATTGAIVLTGTLAIANGGTGNTTGTLAYLGNTQTFTGINTFSDQMTLTKGFDLTLGAVNSFSIRNSSLVTQFTVQNTGVTMGNLVMTGTVLNMSSTSPNAFYSGDNLLISASATVGKNILMTVAGTGFTLDQYGASLGSNTKTFYCNLFEGLSFLGIDMLGYNDSSFKIGNTVNISSQPVGWDFKTLNGSYPSYSTHARISGLGVGTNKIYSFSANPLTLSGANNTIDLQSNGTTRFAITDEGVWMPASGSKSFYITDTSPNTATGHYNRLFATNNKVYNDFYNIFRWRVYSGISPLSGLTEIMDLTTTGLTINKSSISHATLANYELVLGDNSGTVNQSAKILIRGTSASDTTCPSIDFTSHNTITVVQGSIGLYNDGNAGGIFAFLVKASGTGLSGAMQNVMELRATNVNVARLTFPTTVYADIVIAGQLVGGFANSGADVPLKIITGYTLSGSYWYYAGGATWTTTGSQNMSILAYGTISANGGFTLASDLRIKKDIQPAEQGALKVIDSIPIKSYDLIDNYRDGGRTSFNIIAQELIEVFPEAISKGVSYIPSIYSKCQWITVNADEIEIHLNKPHDLVVGDEIEILLEDSSLKECDVTAIINETIFRVKKWDDFKMEITDECFIYGKKVKDFLRIDKTKVSMLALAGTKELHQIVKLQQAKIEEQSQAINTLTESMKFLTEHLAKLTNAFNEIVKEK